MAPSPLSPLPDREKCPSGTPSSLPTDRDRANRAAGAGAGAAAGAFAGKASLGSLALANRALSRPALDGVAGAARGVDARGGGGGGQSAPSEARLSVGEAGGASPSLSGSSSLEMVELHSEVTVRLDSGRSATERGKRVGSRR